MQKQKEADEALVEIQKKMEESNEQKKQIKKIQKDIDAEQKVVTEKKEAIEKKLSGVQPILDSAKEAVGCIQPAHINELRALKQPPQAVQDVLEGVLTLLGQKETSWNAIRKFLAGDSKREIMNFDVSTLTSTLRAQVEKIMNAKGNSYKKEVIERASKAAAPMAEWLKALLEYSVVLETVQPLNDELSKYTENLTRGMEKMKKYEDKSKKVQKTVDELKKNFAEKTSQAEVLKEKLAQAEQLLRNAEDLLGKLSGEKSRWSEQVKVLERDLKQMPRKALIAAAFNTYLGHEPEDVRRRIVDEWKLRLKVEDFQYFTFLRTESTMLQYKAEGLPGDELSMDNAVMMIEQVRTGLIVDPAGQAVDWLTAHLKAKGVSVDRCSFSDERFVSTLELAMRFGKSLVVTDVDRIEAFLYPLLRKELRTEGTKNVIQIGDRRSVDYAENFQLYLFTRSTDLRVPPDALAFLTEISFTITHGGLEGQLLGVTIQNEQPELEQEKMTILQNEEGLKLKLAKLEESLLFDLASSRGSLLENTTLIESLNKIKTQATEIAESLAKSREVQMQLDEKRNVYRPLASTGSTIFFLVRSLIALSHMYQFSLGMYLNLFSSTLAELSADQSPPAEKVKALKGRLVLRVVAAVSRAILKEHRTAFGLHLARALNREAYTDIEWNIFVEKAIVSDAKRAEVRVPGWIPVECRTQYCTLAALMPEFITKINPHESDVWYQWMKEVCPEERFPPQLGKVTPFQRLIVIKVLRSDRLVAAMNMWASELLSVSSLSDSSTLASIVPHTVSDQPILLVTTPGADPSMDLQALAYTTVGRERFHQLAMGGGQQEEALRLLRLAASEGHWLFLKNLHLVIPWVAVLQKELNVLERKPQFRLWLTSEPHDEFPSILLSSAMKMTFEAPPGVKQNMLSTYNMWPASYIDSKSPTQSQLLFSLSWLHATCLERRSFIPQGWAKFYEFSQADIKSASDVIIQQSQSAVDWKTIHGVLENAIYGGRMESEYDVRILRTYLDRFFTPDVLSTSKRQRTLYGDIMLPKSGKHSDCMNVVNALTDSDVPAVFSLPPNADRIVQIARVGAVILQLQRLEETKESSKMTREEWNAKVSPLLATWLELCQPHAELLTHGTTRRISRRETRPVESCINAEVLSSLGLMRKVENAFSDLRKVVEGSMLLSEQRRIEAAALIAGDVPLSWEGEFNGSERIFPWLTALVTKAVAIREWNSLCTSGSLLKSKLNMSNLFRPQTFLNALRQETSHLTREPLVELTLASWLGRPPDNVALPVCLTGLLLQGAVIEEGHLGMIDASDATGFAPMPDVYIAWCINPTPSRHHIGTPVYANASKEFLLTELKLPCLSAEAVSAFTLAGVAIMLEQ